MAALTLETVSACPSLWHFFAGDVVVDPYAKVPTPRQPQRGSFSCLQMIVGQVQVIVQA
jgi:hypothetical protein